jgi:hypothetical protein
MFGTLTAPVRLSTRVVRGIGARRLALLGAGAALGALCTPLAGPELRRRLAAEIAKRRSGAEPTVEERVRRRLAEAPRTWHLPQPEVVAVRDDDGADWRIILAGTAPDDSARTDLEITARAVTGVGAVDNRIRVLDQED